MHPIKASIVQHKDLYRWTPASSDMGCHIDGFIAVVVDTHVVQGGPVTGSQADVVAYCFLMINCIDETIKAKSKPKKPDSVSQGCIQESTD